MEIGLNTDSTPTSQLIMQRAYRTWIKFGHLLGLVQSRILLGLLFFIVITPLALVRRLLRMDPLRLRLDPKVATYRHAKVYRDPCHMEKPF